MQKSDGVPVVAATPVVVHGSTHKQNLTAQLFPGNWGTDGGIVAQLSNNPFFTAGFGLASLGAALAFAQRGVRQGASLLRRHMLVNVEINNLDSSYGWFLNWMTQHQKAHLVGGKTFLQSGIRIAAKQEHGLLEGLLRKITPGMRSLSIQTENQQLPNGTMRTHFSLVPGPGKHVLRYRNAFIMIHRERETKSRDYSAAGKVWETITLTTLYSHRHVFEPLFQEARELAVRLNEGKTIIYKSMMTNWTQFGNPKQKRPLASVVLDIGVKERILADIQDFLASGNWYYDRGIPYRRGYLLHGPPGTGKSSFIQALAGELDYAIAILNISERGLTDDRLNFLLTELPSRTFVALEDVDAAFANRRLQSDEHGYNGANVTFSGLLNALDGVASAEERVIFMTTNHPERLDEALVRPGRVDMTVRLGYATKYQVEQLWNRFYGDLEGSEVYLAQFCNRLTELGVLQPEGGKETTRSISTAALQGLFLVNKEDMEGAASMAETLVNDGNSNAVPQLEGDATA